MLTLTLVAFRVSSTAGGLDIDDYERGSRCRGWWDCDGYAMFMIYDDMID